MRRSSRLAEKPTSTENETQIRPKMKKGRPDNRTSNIVTFDNGTKVEAFKFLNYSQLAKSSLVSKGYRDLIQTHRHSLALLDVEHIRMRSYYDVPTYMKVFDKELSPEDYNEWVIRNNYSQQIPPASGKQTSQYIRISYRFSAEAKCKDSNLGPYVKTTVFSAQTKLNHENWPLFQHFTRLLADPFVYIRHLELTPLKELVKLFTGAVMPDRRRIQCGKLKYNFDGKTKKFLNWTLDTQLAHVRCNELELELHTRSNFDEVFLDLFLTGAHFARNILFCYFPEVFVDFVQQFIGLKNFDASQMVESIRGTPFKLTAEALKSKYEKFFIKEEKNQYDSTTAHIFEFINTDVGKKLQLTVISLMEFENLLILETINL